MASDPVINMVKLNMEMNNTIGLLINCGISKGLLRLQSCHNETQALTFMVLNRDRD